MGNLIRGQVDSAAGVGAELAAWAGYLGGHVLIIATHDRVEMILDLRAWGLQADGVGGEPMTSGEVSLGDERQCETDMDAREKSEVSQCAS